MRPIDFNVIIKHYSQNILIPIRVHDLSAAYYIMCNVYIHTLHVIFYNIMYKKIISNVYATEFG